MDPFIRIPLAAPYFIRLYKLLALPRPPATPGLVLTNSSAVSLSMTRVCETNAADADGEAVWS